MCYQWTFVFKLFDLTCGSSSLRLWRFLPFGHGNVKLKNAPSSLVRISIEGARRAQKTGTYREVETGVDN